jgi:hypothetical protein
MRTLVLTILLAVGSSAAPQAVTFPGSLRATASPAGTHVVEWLEEDASLGRPEHSLVLRSRGATETVTLRTFGRWVRVLWSPDGSLLAVTDGLGSDKTQVSVYAVLSPGAEASQESVIDGAIGGVPNWADHVYFEGIDWVDSRHLKVHAWGYGHRKEFDRIVVVRVGLP